jgi:hypothetical protein
MDEAFSETMQAITFTNELEGFCKQKPMMGNLVMVLCINRIATITREAKNIK